MAFSDNCRLSRQLQTVKTVSEWEDSEDMATADSYKLSRQLHTVVDHCKHVCSFLFS